MGAKPQPAGAQQEGWLPGLFAGLFGAFLGLCLLKFSNTPITEKYVEVPKGIWELLLDNPWPVAWAFWALGLVTVAGIAVARWRLPAPWWVVALPAAWLLWQCIAGAESVDPSLTGPTLRHFGGCVVCFYLGLFSLGRVRRVWPFWLCLICAFLPVLALGWQQHFGGLKEAREYFYREQYPHMAHVPPEYLKRLASERIFSTLFYPNALAGALLLVLPASLAALWQLRGLLTAAARGFLVGAVGLAGLACLYWSGSKGGWLLMLVLGLLALLRVPFSARLKAILVAGVLLAGLAGFFWKHAKFFEKGATSVSARFDYWRAALQTATDKPLFGTGPGTFKLAYEKVKRPESEMARLVHNDYLEQASDSGWVGLAIYVVFVGGALLRAFPRSGKSPRVDGDDWLTFAVWLGVLGWALQGFDEFPLYIPALAWPAFAFLGWLLGRQGPAPSRTPAPRPAG
jgi:hypothetical protein